MSNNFNISVAPEIAAVSALVLTVDNVVDAIRAVDIPANAALITGVKGVVDTIRATDFPALATLLPGNGVPMHAFLRSNSNSLVTVLNIASGIGFLTGIFINNTIDGSVVNIKVTIDGTVRFLEASRILESITEGGSYGSFPCCHRFASSLLVEVKTSAADWTNTSVMYTLE